MTISLYDIFVLLAPPFAASMLFVAIHANFGLHVLRRGVIFVDLALAQMSALGATIAFAVGHVPTSMSGLIYTFLFSAIGAGLLTVGRGLPKVVHTEAYIGILYVVATAATILVVDRSPQGAEHVKQILVGSILTVSVDDLPKFIMLYGAIGVFHWLARGPFRMATEAAAGSPQAAHKHSAWIWDFLFYLSFGAVVTSSVATAGVLLVFCFLIVPAIIGSLFTRRFVGALLIGWFGGAVASAVGLAASFGFDLPAGAAMVLAFSLTLASAMVLRAFVSVSGAARKARFCAFFQGVSAIVLTIVCAGMIWFMSMPTADQPLLDVLEWASGMGPETIMTPGERAVYADAMKAVSTRQAQAMQFTLLERQTRPQSQPLSDDEVRRMGAFQQAFNEMARGEDFVATSLSGQARARERWYVGPAVLVAAMLGLLAVTPRKMRARFFNLSRWRRPRRMRRRPSL
ncbi:zinc/manganese transport system permease protein [Paraburkholderia sp. BL6669N2]|uniref:metal ABC transporter permease n=1 Tax=Paraburkholderia sp. BL6669N2 TaxID=1938807 RepID=UPI000E2533E4|nr:metal ABC transporter permease [Paraburkholderia sp. BL6669N2]REG49124.1 zinc/manganese transport system permease protein [Paraburkholderia sp. BL6669N2]